jgi:hypothetical protein
MWLLSSLLQLEEGTVDLFSKTVKYDGLAIDLDVAQKPRSISLYIQAWHNQIWELGFNGFFRARSPTLRQRHSWTRG